MENLQKWNKGNYFYQALERAVTGVLWRNGVLSVSLVTNHHKLQGPVDERDRQPVSAHQLVQCRRRLQLTQLPHHQHHQLPLRPSHPNDPATFSLSREPFNLFRCYTPNVLDINYCLPVVFGECLGYDTVMVMDYSSLRNRQHIK